MCIRYRYIAQVEGDTTLNALQEEATFLELVKQNNNKTVAYGYTVDATVQARIEGLAPVSYTHLDVYKRQE